MALRPISVIPDAQTRILSPVSQEGNGVLNDCGPAAMLMLLQDCGLAEGETVARWAGVIDPTHDGTTAANLGAMARQLGGMPEYGLAAQYPYIELAEYRKLPFINPNYAGRTFKHWIVRESDTTYFDPLWPAAQAGRKTTTKAVLDAAEAAITARVGLSNPRILDIDMPIHDNKPVKGEVLAESWRVRTDTDGKAPTLGVLTRGQTFEAVGTATVGTDKWAAVRLGAGGAGLSELNEITLTTGGVTVAWTKYGAGWKVIAPAPPPVVVPPPSAFRLGVSVLSAHHLLEPAYSAGIRSFLIMDGVVAAVNFKRAHPDAIVMYRRFLPQGSGIPPASAFSAEAAMGNGIVFVSPLNECDNHCYGTVAEIEARARFDNDLARMCKQHGTVYAAGGFSMGTPDFTKPDICEAMRRWYAPGYNAGLYAMNWHTYSPTMGWIYGHPAGLLAQMAKGVMPFSVDDDGVIEMRVGRSNTVATFKLNGRRRATAANDPIGQRIWFERRWEFLFDSCGFDINPNLLGIYSDETGVDEGGVGGFPAHGAGDAEIERWGREYCALQRLALNGGPSVMRAATIFQAGDGGRWGGYNVAGNFGAIARANQ